jgi:hypothetical protein
VKIGAGVAETVDLDDMGENLAAEVFADLFFDGFHATEVEVLHPPAVEADKVVMMVLVGAVEIIELPVRVKHFGDDATGGKLFQIAVNCGEADPVELFLELEPDFIGTYIGWFLGQQVQDSKPLGSGFQIEPLEGMAV